MANQFIRIFFGRSGLFAENSNRGFALPIALALGMVMIAISVTSALVAQGDRDLALRRKESGASVMVGDSAVARAILQLSQPNNSVLLVRNYDSINTKTGKTYLGADGIPNSGDETGTATDQWTGYNPSGAPCFQQLGRTAPNMTFTGTIGPDETYTIRAYRYDKQKKLGTLLVEGNYRDQGSLVAVTISIEPILDDFPSILLNQTGAPGILALRGRHILGLRGNIYYSPPSSADSSLTGISKPGDSSRPNYLAAIYSSNTQDGATGDTVAGKIFACRLTPNIPAGITGTNFGIINSSRTLNGVGGAIATLYQVDKIDLSNNSILTVNTTGGPVIIDVTDKGNSGNNPDLAITLRHTSKILNIRTDGQPPKVGDLRIIIRGDSQTNLYDQTCIQNAFFYARADELRLLTSGPGCPGGKNTNFEGVIWAEEILSSKNLSSNRSIANYFGGGTTEFDSLVTPGVTSGIDVPDNLTSLADLLEYVDWPALYKYGVIKNWQRVN